MAEEEKKAVKDDAVSSPKDTENTVGTEVEQKPETKKKKRGIVKKIFIGLGIILLIGILWLGWLGFVPVLSNLLGANNARDLGVTYTAADLTAFYDKTSQKVKNFADAPTRSDGKKTIFADPKQMSVTISQEEITARIADLADWVYMPIKNVQVAFSDDNVIEVSGNLVTDVVDEFVNFIGGVGYSQEDVQTGLNWLGRFAGNPAIYLKTRGSIINNRLSLELLDAKIGRWTPPKDEALKVLTTGTINALAGTKGLDVDSATFSDGQMHFDGVGPTTIYVKTN